MILESVLIINICIISIPIVFHFNCILQLVYHMLAFSLLSWHKAILLKLICTVIINPNIGKLIAQ